MNKLIKANIEKLNRLVDVSRTRRSAEMDFFTEASNNFLNYPLASNPNEDKSLADIIINSFVEEAQRPLDGVIARQTKLNLNIKNISQEEIKADKKYIADYFKRLDQVGKLGGYLIVGVEEITPDNLPSFIANYENININGTSERVKDRNMFMAAGWATLFNYFDDVTCNRDFYFKETVNGELTIFEQTVDILISGETFKKFLHKRRNI
jgi:hypothetical protein